MTTLRALKVSITIGVALLVLACRGPTGFDNQRDLVDDSDRADCETAAAAHDDLSSRVARTPSGDD
jgi:hypothetical protein